MPSMAVSGRFWLFSAPLQMQHITITLKKLLKHLHGKKRYCNFALGRYGKPDTENGLPETTKTRRCAEDRSLRVGLRPTLKTDIPTA